MKDSNIILEKSYAFSLRIIKLFIHLRERKTERALILQLLKSGTSIGANIEEAVGAQSKRDFISKMSIAYKETRETIYWLRLLKDADLLNNKLAESFLTEIEEIKKIITAILKSSKESNSGTHS
jgi:four helix bundle protein